MRNIISIFLLTYSLLLQSNLALARKPSIPGTTKDLDKEICFYEENVGRPEFDVMLYIPIFENLYNSNQIEEVDLKRRVFCILLTFYKADDPFYAEDFQKEMPLTECQKVNN